MTNQQTNPTPEERHAAALLQYFTNGDHLPRQVMRDVSIANAVVARQMAALLPDGPELVAGLRKLLEAKDCFVRASMDVPEGANVPSAGAVAEGIYMGGYGRGHWPAPTRAEAEGKVDDQGQAFAWADEPTGTGPRRPPVEDVPLNHLSDERPPTGAVEGASMPGGVVDEVEHWRGDDVDEGPAYG